MARPRITLLAAVAENGVIGRDNGLIWRLPPAEGVADVDVFLMWNREQRMTRAEAVFLESFRRAIELQNI